MSVEPIFRRARREDAAALVDLIWIAGESSSKSVYEVFFGGNRDSMRDRLRRLILAQTRTHFSYGNFFVADVHGVAVAGACGFDPRSSGKQNLLPALRETGWSPIEVADAMERMGAILTCAAEELPDAWVLEHVASLPRFRGRGLAREVVVRVIEEGFGSGFDRIQLSVLVGNDVARKLYVNLGFRLEGRPRTDPRFEAAMGSPGTETLVLSRPDWIPPSPEIAGEHSDFAATKPVSVESTLAFWERQLGGAPPFVDLPTDRARSLSQSFTAATSSLRLGPRIATGLEDLARREAASPLTVLLCAFNVLLSRHSGQEDLVIGTAIAEEDPRPTKSGDGLFVNKVPLRANLSGDPTFRELLARVQSGIREALPYQDVRLERLAEKLRTSREPGRPPIFQIFFGLLDGPAAGFPAPGLAAQGSVDLPGIAPPFDLSFYAATEPEDLRLIAIYNADLFDEVRIREMLEQFGTLLEQVLGAPSERIDSYSLTTELSRRLSPDPTAALPEPDVGLVIGEFLAWASRAPNAAALVDDGRVVSYAELEAHSRRLAETLVDRGVTRGDVVAVTGARSSGLIVAMLGVLRSGGVLLTLDPALPIERRGLMVSEAGARRVVLVGDAEDESVRGLEMTGLREDGSLVGSRPGTVVLPTSSPDDPAYIFFTSGTSGVPKGVLGSQKGLAHFLKWQRETFAIGPGDRCAHLTGLSFDVVLRDVFLPLTSGASLHLPPVDGDTVASKTLVWLERERITALHTVPSIAQSWLAAVPGEIRLPRLRWAFFAGEPLTDGLIRRWVSAFSRSGRIVNLYGPTETTLAKCFFVVPDNPPPGIQPVGRALPETQAVLMAQGRRPCGIGEIGEIVLRTPFRTLGYVNAPNEQRSRFFKNPFRNDDRDLLYRTGDRGRYLLNGSLEILGRVDDQVKIRGVRVEPQEIAVVLARHRGVASCAVLPRRHKDGEIGLVAYVVGRGDPPVTVEELRRDLARQLSPVMIPAAFVFLSELPLTPNGKLDRAALTAPELASGNRNQPAVAPRTPIEEVIASIWASVLRVEHVGIDDDFFELGGHSLKAAQVVSRVGQAFGLDLSLRSMFEAPTVGLLASTVEEALLDEVERELPAEAPGDGYEESALLGGKAILD